ncbi:MAG: hypothetical protein V8Q84_10425 [Bilophila sp.]
MEHLLHLRQWGGACEVLVIGDDRNDLPMIRLSAATRWRTP